MVRRQVDAASQPVPFLRDGAARPAPEHQLHRQQEVGVPQAVPRKALGQVQVQDAAARPGRAAALPAAGADWPAPGRA